MALVTLAVIATLTIVASVYAGRKYRTEIKPYWDPAVGLFTILRFVAVLLVAYGLWISGRIVLQFLAVLVIALVGLYVAIEKPHEDFGDND